MGLKISYILKDMIKDIIYTFRYLMSYIRSHILFKISDVICKISFFA